MSIEGIETLSQINLIFVVIILITKKIFIHDYKRGQLVFNMGFEVDPSGLNQQATQKIGSIQKCGSN